MKNVKILVSGMIDLQTIGRQVVGFVGALLHDRRNEVYLDELWFHEDTIKTLENIWGKELIKNVKRSKDLPSDYEYDFLVYPWIFGYAFSDKFSKTLDHKAKIKICYPVYDGSVPPLEWIEVINKNFDICVCPSDYCAHNLKRYGVTRDCFGLELVVLIDGFSKIHKKKHNKIRFGCLSASENRKNLPLLIESFQKAFGDKDDVELVLKTTDRHDAFASIQDLENIVSNCGKNVILETKFLSHSEMEDLISSFDVYVNPQKTVGFYTSSIEMMALGIPQILSDIPVHREVEKFISADNNIIFIPHNQMEFEFHAAFDYRLLGARFQGKIDDYVQAFRYFYENRGLFLTDELVQERKEAAAEFFQKTIKKYNQMIHPNNVVLSERSYIENDTFFMSKCLLKKYINMYEDLNICKNKYMLPEKLYDEENSLLFKSIENISVRDQNLYLREQGKGEQDKYAKKIRKISQENGIKVPYFVYKIFKMYSKIVRKKEK